MQNNSSSIETMNALSNDPAFNQLSQQFEQINSAFIQVFKDDRAKSNLLSKNQTASLYSQACNYLSTGSSQEPNDKKKRIIIGFRKWMKQFIQIYLLQQLAQKHSEHELIKCFIQKWEHFKKFCYFYFFVFKAADSHYESTYKQYKNQGKANILSSEDSIFPIPAIAINYFKTLVYQKYKSQINKNIRYLLSQQRENRSIDRQALRSLFEIIYSCGLGQLSRINSVKGSGNQFEFQFSKTNNKQVQDYFCNSHKNPDTIFFDNILNCVIQDIEVYYNHLFKDKISQFGPHQDFAAVLSILEKEQQMSEHYLFNHLQKQAYMKKIKEIIVVTNLQERLTRENSLVSLLQKFDHTSDEYLKEIKVFADIIFKSKKQSLKILENVMKIFLTESGTRVNEKLNKRRQYMNEVVNLKKSVNRIINEVMHKSIEISVIRDSCFKKILDSIQASRSLAEFTDLKIKQCIKNKIVESDFGQKTKEIFLILENLVSIDSYLIYHQQLLGRRLLQPLNDPKVDIEKYILKKIGEKLGVVSVSLHMHMLKDIDKSQQISENYSKKLPFARFKWNCRIISPNFWPDNINNNHIQITLPEAVRLQAETICQFYSEDYSRFLSWKVDKGSSLFQANFQTGKFRFQSENIFLMLLLHISEGKNNELRFWELLQKITKMKEGGINHLMKCVKVLIENGVVIRSNPNLQENIQQGEILSIQKNFKPPPNHKPNQPILIKASAQMHRAMHESTVQQNKILKQREKVVEAVIVKLLKHSHSTGGNMMTYQGIVKGVREYEHLKNFDISEGVIKLRIQEVIARGYCERDQDDRKIFRYIA